MPTRTRNSHTALNAQSLSKPPHRSKVRSFGGAIALVLCTCSSFSASGAAVQSFSPQGQAKGVRQVTARFSEPMVAFGDPRLADPFNVQCDGDAGRLKGRGR